MTASPLGEVVQLFLKLGTIAFGGPAAHIAMMRDEVVRRRRWVTDREFVDLLGMTNLIPGPNSTEMAIHLGFVRAGWRGLVLGGACFILPAMLIVLAFAWMYVRYGSTPEVVRVLYGIKPVVIAIVVHALVGLARTAIRTTVAAIVAIAVIALYLARANELVLLFGGGVVVLLWRNVPTARRGASPIALLALPAAAPVAAGSAAAASLTTLFLTFLKIGSVLYGSGYVLLAFLRNDFVHRLGWLTDQQLLDAVAVGQFTPGPVFTTATFVGYIVAGWPGAVLGTIGIFLPSFVFVALTNPLVRRIRGSPVLSALLDGVNAAALGLMAGVALELGRAAIVDWLTTALAIAAATVLMRSRINSAWLIAAGAAAGLSSWLLGR